MTREIKFRCWYDNQMHKVQDISFRHKTINLFGADIIKFEDGILMQYTDLKDKSGVEIYEGDICVGNGHIEKDNEKFIIKYGKYKTEEWQEKYSCNTYQFGWYAEFIKSKSQVHLVIPNGIRVIGNIYEDLKESGE